MAIKYYSRMYIRAANTILAADVVTLTSAPEWTTDTLPTTWAYIKDFREKPTMNSDIDQSAGMGDGTTEIGSEKIDFELKIAVDADLKTRLRKLINQSVDIIMVDYNNVSGAYTECPTIYSNRLYPALNITGNDIGSVITIKGTKIQNNLDDFFRFVTVTM